MKKIIILLAAVLCINVGACFATQSEYVQGYNYGFNLALNHTFGLDTRGYSQDFIRGFYDGQTDGQNYENNLH